MPFKDPLYRAQFLRTLSHAVAGGADINECLITAEKIREPDAAGWFRAWMDLAEQVERQAEAAAAAGHAVSAASLYLKASNYFRTAYIFLMQPDPDRGLAEAFRRQRTTFERWAALQQGAVEVISIPYPGAAIPGYFLKAQGPGPKPTLIITGGYDSTAEESFFYSGPAALARGYNVLTYDGPGQGALLIEAGIPSRPDWEAVLQPVIDWLRARPEVDPARITQLGLSFGGYLAPRAASGVEGLAALVADPGQLSLLEEIRAHLPPSIARELPDGDAEVLKGLEQMIEPRMRHPTEGWGLRRALWVHNVDSPLAYMRMSAEYTSEGRARNITCPTLIMSAEADEIGATADRLYEALTCEKTRLRFTTAEGTGSHCECGGRVLANQRMFDWLDDVLAKAGAAARTTMRAPAA